MDWAHRTVWRRVSAAAATFMIVLALTTHPAYSKTTTWTNASPANDLWSNPDNWDVGIPSFFDVVYFAPVGGTSTQDIVGLGVDQMDMTGYTGTLTLVQPIAVAGDLVVAGTLDAGGTSIDVGGSLTVDGTLTATGATVLVLMDLDVSGSLTVDGGGVTTVTGSVTVGPPATLDMSDGVLDVGGDLDLGAATMTSNAGSQLRFSGSGTQTWSAGSSSSSYGNVQVDGGGGGGAVVLSAPGNLVTLGDLDIPQGTLELSSGDLHVTGNTSIAPTGALTNPSDAGATLQFDGTVGVSGTFSSSAGSCTLRFGAGTSSKVTLTVPGLFSVSGQPGNRTTLEQDGVAGGTQWILEYGPGTSLIFTDVEVQDSDAQPGPIVPANSVDLGNNTNWDFGTKSTTWTGGGITGNWSEFGNWNNGVPATGDTVFFDPVGGPSVMDIPSLGLSTLDMTGFSGALTLDTDLDVAGFVTLSGTFELAGRSLTVGGDLTVGGSLDASVSTLTAYGSVHVVAGGMLGVHDGTLELEGDLIVDPGGGSAWDIAGAGTLRFTGTAAQIWSDESGAASYAYVMIDPPAPGGHVVIPASSPPLTIGGELNVGGSGGTIRIESDLIVGGGTFVAHGASAELPYWSPGHPIVTFDGPVDVGGTFSATGDGGTLRFAAGAPGAVTVEPGATFEVVGTPSNRIALEQDGVAGGSQWLFKHDATAVVTFDHVRVQDSDASTGPTVVATDGVDDGNNINWNFPPKATAWIGGGITGNWSDGGNWNRGVPLFGDTVLFDPIGGPSIMDIPGLTLSSMNMGGFSGSLTLDHDLDIAGFVTVSGSFGLASHSLTVGGDLTVGGTMDATSAGVSVTGSVHVVSGGVLEMNDGSLVLEGDLIVDPGGSSLWDRLTGLLRFAGSGTQYWADQSGSAAYGTIGIDSLTEVVDQGTSDILTGSVDCDGDLLTGDYGHDWLFGGTTDSVLAAGAATSAYHVEIAGGLHVVAGTGHTNATFNCAVDLFGSLSATGGSSTLRFAPGVTGGVNVGPAATFEMAGVPGDRVRLEQDGVAGGSQWILDHDPTAALVFENVEVQDCDAEPGPAVATGTSIDLGNNTHWVFPIKSTVWVGGGITDDWSEFDNWDNGVPAAWDTVGFDPVGGPSVMDIPGLTLGSMDMGGFSGSLSLDHDLDIAGFVHVSGSFALESHSLTVGGKLTVGGTLDATSAGLSVGDSLRVTGGTLVAHGGVLDLYGPMDGTIGAVIDFDSLTTMRARDDIDVSSFSWGLTLGRLESRGSSDHEFRSSGHVTFSDIVIDHSSSNVKRTFKGGPVAVRNQFDGLEGELELQVDSLTIGGDATFGSPGGPLLRVTGTGVSISILGQTLAGDFAFEQMHSTASLRDVSVTGTFDVQGAGSQLRIAASHVMTVQPGAALNVVGGTGADRYQLRLDGTPLSDEWLLDVRPGAAMHFENIEVQDSDASPGETCTASGECIDLGNNTNWQFVGTAAGDTAPTRLALRAVPNPFNPGTTIHYTVPRSGRVTIRIYDVRGALVRTVFAGPRPRGVYTAPWDGTDDARSHVGSGVYFCRIESGGEQRVQKLVLLK